MSLSKLFLVAGVSLILFASHTSYQKRALSFNVNSPIEQTESSSATVSEIRLGALNIALPVTEAKIENGIWEISETGASHLAQSASPSENGNIVIYAHNDKNLFGPIRSAKIGQIIEIKTSDGKSYLYKINNSETISPDNVEPVLPTNNEKLTIYTCTGFLNNKRFVLTAVPLS